MWVDYALRQAASFAFTLLRLLPLQRNNRSAGPIIPATGPCLISLTSHGKRLRTVHYTIESLAKGAVKAPIELWLDPEDYDAEWPAPLQRLAARGLRIRRSDGHYGPHTKYWGAFREVVGTGTTVVTVDDDMIYPVWFLQRLLYVAALRDDIVVAYRAHRIELRDGALLPYVKWSACNSCAPSVLHFATGVSGVLYPPSLIDYVVRQGDVFMQLCPTADDVWLHACELRSHHRVRQAYAQPRAFALVPAFRLTGLVRGNLTGGNDQQINRVYTAQDIAMLMEASAEQD